MHPGQSTAAALRAPLLLLLLLALPAAAQVGPIELADDPFEVTDPEAEKPGVAEVSVIGTYQRARRGRTRGTVGLETEMEVGVAPGLELRVGQIGAYGNLDVRRRLGAALPDELDRAADDGGPPSWGGATRLGALVQLSEGGGVLPAAGLLGRVRRVYGPGRPAQEAEVIALLGKVIRAGDRPIGVNLNLGWTARLDPQPGDRPSRYLLIATVGQVISNDTALVASYLRQQQDRGERDFDLIQAGVRYRPPGGAGAVIGLAGGVGLTRDSPRFQVAFAVQWAIGPGAR